MHEAAADPPQVAESSPIQMAEERAGAAGEDGGHPAAVGREAGVADGVDTVMDPVPAPLVQATLDLRPRVAELLHLTPSHHAVLDDRQFRDTCVI